MAVTTKFLEGLRIQGRSDDSLAVTPTRTDNLSSNTGWTESSGNVTIDEGNSEMDFSIESGSNTAKGYYDLTTVSDTAWVLRFEDLNFSTINTYGGMWLGISSITTMDQANSGSSIITRLADFGDGDDYLIVESFNNSTTKVTGSIGRPALATSTNYNLEIIRDGTTITTNLYTTAFTGTPLATSTDTISGTTGLRYLCVENYYNTGSGNSNTNFVGTIDGIKFYNGVTDASDTAKDKSTITDVPVGTRYEEIDTRKIFRMSTVPNVVIDFTGAEATASNWTHPSTDSGGNSGAHGFSVTTESSLTGSAGTIDITGRDWDSTIDMVTHCGLATAIPAQTKFVIDWDFYRHSDDTSDHPVFAFSSEAHGVDPRGGNSSKEVVWACEQNNQDDSPYDGQNSVKLYCKNSSGTSYGNTITVSGDSTSLQTKGETRYWRCIYGETASTYLSVRLQRYDTAVNRTAGGSTGRELNLVSGGWASATAQTAWEAGDPIRYFTLLTYNNGQKAFSIDNITWYDDSLTAVAKVPSWVEKGTA